VKTVILCGGKGTRAYPATTVVPKPLLEVGDRPMLQHVLELYAAQGHCDFVLAAGYKAELFEAFAEGLPSHWRVDVVDTGLDTNTGGRVSAVRDRVGDTFFCTYADGLGDVDLQALLDFHRSHGSAATLTTVPLPSQYGTIEFDSDGKVARFREKPRLPEHRINAGFFVFDQRVFDLWWGEDLERQVLPHLAGLGELCAYAHEGFWKSADTYKDTQELAALWADGAPWLLGPLADAPDGQLAATSR
jgi:glucose-1-phosphate cytidylyltransferase